MAEVKACDDVVTETINLFFWPLVCHKNKVGQSKGEMKTVVTLKCNKKSDFSLLFLMKAKKLISGQIFIANFFDSMSVIYFP
jgi:hypothetical protein